ncbi:Topless-related protein 4 [Melia azedarach]|uniref:Topless-related protein 4 n=1 Tax=Melia azedarach TaxID=155640 RepID=A0ACC1XA20_MELAZ|nr:Topless-related protein 4 [Melia azedarach]
MEEENCKESPRALEQESKIFFNMNHFGETIISGEWEKAEKYLLAFTKLDDNSYSRTLFFELCKQKYYEAMCRNDHTEAVNIFWKDLKVFSIPQTRINCELAELFALKDLREDEQLSWHTKATSARAKLHDDLKLLVKENPILQDKLIFPIVNNSALLSLIKLICPSFQKKTRGVKEELIYLIFQFLGEEEYKETLHKFEQETKVFFNMNYFAEYITNGEWDIAEKYLSAFTKMDDNSYSAKMFLEIQRQKQKKLPSRYAETAHLYNALKGLVENNRILQDKLKFPRMDKSRLLTLVEQIMDWWVPYHVNMMPNDNNETISLKDIPTVPYLIHDPSLVINNSSQEEVLLAASSGDGFKERTSLADVNSSVCTKPMEKSVIWKLQQMNELSECRALVLPDNLLEGRVVRLIYSGSGDSILALTQNATHKLWSPEKENINMQLQLYEPSSTIVMTNEIGADPKNVFPCFAMKGSYLFSASGGRISIFSLETFETLATFANPPPTATYFIFLPQNLFAIGFDDSSILIHCPYAKKTKAKLKGHENRITCLAFSYNLNVLVSSAADAQLCVWDANGWKKLCSKFLQCFQTGSVPENPIVNHIQFHPDQIHLVSVHEGQIDVYEAPTLNHILQLVPEKLDLPITYATYSCDGKLIYVSCKSGCIKVLAAATLDLQCQINLTAYAQPSTTSLELYPVIIAAHPSEANQIAVGLTDGRVHVLEPLQSEVEWGKLHPLGESREFSTTSG